MLLSRIRLMSLSSTTAWANFRKRKEKKKKRSWCQFSFDLQFDLKFASVREKKDSFLLFGWPMSIPGNCIDRHRSCDLSEQDFQFNPIFLLLWPFSTWQKKSICFIVSTTVKWICAGNGKEKTERKRER